MKVSLNVTVEFKRKKFQELHIGDSFIRPSDIRNICYLLSVQVTLASVPFVNSEAYNNQLCTVESATSYSSYNSSHHIEQSEYVYVPQYLSSATIS